MKNKINKEKLKKIAFHIWSFLTALSIILAILLMSLTYNSKNINYFETFQRENNIDQVTGKSLEELSDINLNIYLYLDYGDNALLEPYFNQKEILHMEDVHKLYDLAYLVMNICTTFAITSLLLSHFFRKKHELFKNVLKYIFIILGIFAILAILMYFDFNRYFIIFHKIFFNNDLWLLDPRTDLMIQMMPLNFFIGICVNILKDFGLYLSLILAVIVIDVFITSKNRRCSSCNTPEVE